MNKTTGGRRRCCRSRRQGVLAVMAGIVMLAAACGGSPSSTDTGVSGQFRQNLAFAQCMRSHGVPNWPDPVIGPNGGPIFKVSAAGITHTQTHSPPMDNTIMMCLRVDPAPVAMA